MINIKTVLVQSRIASTNCLFSSPDKGSTFLCRIGTSGALHKTEMFFVIILRVLQITSVFKI